MIKRPMMKWVRSFDVRLPLGDGLVVPGNEAHIRLQHHENLFRSFNDNFDAITKTEFKLQCLREQKAALEEAEASSNTPKQRIMAAAIALIKAIYTGRAGTVVIPYREAFRTAISDLIGDFDDEDYFTELKETNFLVYVIDDYTSFHDYFDSIYSLSSEIPFCNDGVFDLDLVKNFLSDLDNLAECGIDLSLSDILLAVEVKEPSGISAAKKTYLGGLERYGKSSREFEKGIAAVEAELKGLEAKIIAPDPRAKSKSTNFVLAEIGFVVELAAAQFRFISFPVITANRDVHNIYDTFDHRFDRLVYVEGGKRMVRNSIIDEAILRKQGLDSSPAPKEYSTSNYEQLYYHSEQDLYVHLERPETISWLVARLGRELGAEIPLKLHCVVLDLHSTNYMCDGCQKATVHMQSQDGTFLRLLKKTATTHFSFDASSAPPLAMITRVSADMQYKMTEVAEADHKPLGVEDIGNSAVIFSMDSFVMRLHERFIPPRTDRERFRAGLHRYSVLTSGGSDTQTTKFLPVIYNQLVLPTKIRAADVIYGFWKKHRRAPEDDDSTESPTHLADL